MAVRDWIMGISKIALDRGFVGGLIGLIVFSVDAVATLIRFVLNPSVAERATVGSFPAMLLFLLLFVAAGALAGYLCLIRVTPLRFVSIGALVGALVWSKMTLTWPLTARPTAMLPPQTSVTSAVCLKRN